MKDYFSWANIFGWPNIITVVCTALLMAAILTYTQPIYLLNVAGISATTFILQMIGKAVYTLWSYFKKS